MEKIVELDGFQFIVEEKIIGLICEDEEKYTIIMRPNNKLANALKNSK